MSSTADQTVDNNPEQCHSQKVSNLQTAIEVGMKLSEASFIEFIDKENSKIINARLYDKIQE